MLSRIPFPVDLNSLMSEAALSASQVRTMLDLVADRIIAAEPELSQADRDLGDGDHGLGMARGMTAAKEALASAPDDAGVPDLFKAHGAAMMASMGGASGVVFGSLFRGTAKAIKDAETYGAAELAAGLTEAIAAIQKRGGAKAGDKTMLDALIPAAEAAAAAADAGQSISEALDAAAAAAESGREASKDFIATMGRAKTLGEKSIGFPDAGACSVAIILRTMAEFAASA